MSHEYYYDRSASLAENVARWGASSIVVTTGDPALLLTTLSESVDVVILDAPCSGEGMFRKLSFAESDWSIGKVESCARIQHTLVDIAAKLLKKDGVLMYSTCTFNPAENEHIINDLLSHGDMELIPLPRFAHLSRGIQMEEALRLFPHEFQGEGHFMAALRKTQGESRKPRSFKGQPLSPSIQKKILVQFPLKLTNGSFYAHQNLIYWLPDATPELPTKLGLRRTGLHLGELKGEDFIPDHALALSIDPVEDIPHLNLSYGDQRATLYLKGESFRIEDDVEGWVIVTYDYVPLGWAKVTHHQLKNKLPKEWRQK